MWGTRLRHSRRGLVVEELGAALAAGHEDLEGVPDARRVPSPLERAPRADDQQIAALSEADRSLLPNAHHLGEFLPSPGM